MRILFLVRGFGEYAQAFAVAKLLRDDSQQVLFISDNEFITEIIKTDGFDVLFLKSEEEIKKSVEGFNGDVLFLCNSHTTIRYQLEKPPHIKKVFSLDSNWYFNNNLYPYKTYEWVDVHYVVFPKRYFEQNLKENGGHYIIDPFFKNKIYNPGFVPVGKKLNNEEKKLVRRKFNISDEKKLVTIYFSSPKVMPKHPFLQIKIKLSSQIEDLISKIEKDCKTEVILIDLSTEAEDINLDKTNDFDELVASSDLMIMHHGYGTLPKLFNNQIPIISFTEIPENSLYASFFELTPAINAKALKHFFYNNYKLIDLELTIKTLLFDEKERTQMAGNQKSIFENGEKNLLKHFYLQNQS